jgi:hypothetical protein
VLLTTSRRWRLAVFGLVGKFHPFLGEDAPRNLADLVDCGVCPSTGAMATDEFQAKLL